MKKLHLALSVFLFNGFFTLVVAQERYIDPSFSYKNTFNNSYEDGVLDTSFANKGILKIHKNDDGFTQLIIQPDNRIIGACYYDFYISRFIPDGKIDSTFGSGGFIQALNISQGGQVYDIKLQSDGKVVAAGTYNYNWYPAEWHSAIVRLTSGGWPDPTFGSGGKIIDSGEPVYRIYTSVAIQPDNRILVAGTGRVSGIDKIVICRYTSSGNLDYTFGTNGQIVTSLGNGNHECPKMLLLENGKILLSATAVDQGTRNAGIMRLLTDGSIDSSFGVNGKYLVPCNAYASGFYGNSFFFQSGGKTVLNCGTSIGNNGLLIRFTSEGFPDSTFGNSGRVQLPDPGYQGAVSQWDDKIIAGVNGFRIIRLNTVGMIDSTFGTNGYVSTRIDSTSYQEQVCGLAIQHGGKILAGGFTFMPNPVYPENISVYSMTRYFSGLDCPDPVAHFTYQVIGDSAIHFQDKSSSACQWSWNFGDNTFSSEPNPVHIFSEKGKYLVCLSIKDTCGSSQFCDTVYFCDHVNTRFSYSGENLTIHFSDSSNQATVWHWDFGDGTFSEIQNPDHVFSEYKTYFVCFSAKNLCNTETFCDSIILKPNGIIEPEFNKLKIYPNPVSNMLKVEVLSTDNFEGILQILNIYGVKLLEKEIHNQINLIDIENIPPGVYQLFLFSKEKTSTKKFIKIN